MNISQHRLVDHGQTMYNVLHFKGFIHAKGYLFYVRVKRLEKSVVVHYSKLWTDSCISGNTGYLG